VPPETVFNRWIVPSGAKKDYLSLYAPAVVSQSVRSDDLSTNMNPLDLADGLPAPDRLQDCFDYSTPEQYRI
jgi:hypothetical protein